MAIWQQSTGVNCKGSRFLHDSEFKIWILTTQPHTLTKTSYETTHGPWVKRENLKKRKEYLPPVPQNVLKKDSSPHQNLPSSCPYYIYQDKQKATRNRLRLTSAMPYFGSAVTGMYSKDMLETPLSFWNCQV